MNKQRLDYITIFRFFAAFYVFAFHANMRIPVGINSYIDTFVSNGAVGMSLFFVLSGFILTYNYNNGIGSNYYKKRIKRIYPAYIFCGILTLPMLILDVNGNIQSISKIVASIILYITSMQAWFYTAFSYWQFGGTWSISVEMFFYALFPFILSISNSKSPYILLVTSFVLTSIIIPLSLLYGDNITFPVYYSVPIYRLPEFVFGIAAAKIMMSGFKINGMQAMIALLILIVVLSHPVLYYMQYNFIIIPCIAIFLVYASRKSVFNLFKPLVYLGEISYSFYLMQCAGFMIFDRIRPDFIYNSGLYGWVILFIVFTIMAGISHSLFEKRNAFSIALNMLLYKKRESS